MQWWRHSVIKADHNCKDFAGGYPKIKKVDTVDTKVDTPLQVWQMDRKRHACMQATADKAMPSSHTYSNLQDKNANCIYIDKKRKGLSVDLLSLTRLSVLLLNTMAQFPWSTSDRSKSLWPSKKSSARTHPREKMSCIIRLAVSPPDWLFHSIFTEHCIGMTAWHQGHI